MASLYPSPDRPHDQLADKSCSQVHTTVECPNDSPLVISLRIPFELISFAYKEIEAGTMLRNPASRSLFRTLASSSAPHFRPVHQTSKLYTRTSHRPQLVINAVRRPVSALLVRQQSTQWTIDHKHEAEVGREKLKANPQSVTPTSSVNPVLHDAKTSDLHGDTDMMAGIRADMVCLSCSILAS